MNIDSKFLEALKQNAKKYNIDVLVVGAFIYRSDNRVLLLQRKYDDFLGGFYELPSGNIESKETIVQALIREIKEETGIEISEDNIIAFINHFDYYSQDKNKKKRQLNFAVFISGNPTIKLSPEHHSYQWVNEEILYDRRIDKLLKQILKKFFDWKKSY